MRKLLVLFAMAAALVGCSRVETGEIGLRKEFGGTVQQDPLGVGFHQTIVGSVLIFSARETLMTVEKLHPVTADKLPMEDVDIQYTYRVNPAAIPRLYTKYSTSYHIEFKDETYVMAGMIDRFVRSAISDAIAKYPALQVNDKRSEIVGLIQSDVTDKLKKEGLADDITIGQIVFTNVSIPTSIVASTQKVVSAQNDAKAAEFTANQQRISAQGTADAAVIKAKGEAAAIAAQAQTIREQGGEAYIKLEAIRRWNGVLPPQYAHLPLPFIGDSATK